jgi:hypothetical protein
MSSLRSIGRVLDSLTELGPIVTRVQYLMAVQQLYLGCITPELAARSRISHEKDGIVFIQADSAAVAARLRNSAPRILRELSAHWPNLTGIQVGAQPTLQRAASTPHKLDASAKQYLGAFGDGLENGALKDALTRLSRR